MVDLQPTAEGYYIGVVHPAAWHDIVTMTARAAWKHQHHVARWERRYGKHYPAPRAEVGHFEGPRFVMETS